MARPITNIKPMQVPQKVVTEQNINEVTKAVSDHKEAILKGIELLATLHESGFLDIVDALTKRKKDALEHVVTLLEKEEYASVLESMSKLVVLIGELNVDELRYLIDKLNNGLRELKITDESVKTSYMDLIKAVNHPDINRSITMILALLRGMGR